MGLILFLIVVACSIPLSIFRGLVIVSLWNWFVISQFPQMPAISITGAIGLSLFVSLFQSMPESKKSSDKPALDLFKILAKGGFLTLTLWGIAYVVHLCM